MPDLAGVYERISVREYLEFFADAYSVTEHGTNYRVVDAVMDLVDLTKLSDKLVSTMSKGMKQRLQLARTLLHDPEVLILDEPASDLDPRARIEMRDLLGELRELGKTIFLSSHILTELSDVCTSVAIMERGRLVVAGPIREIAERLRAVQAGSHRDGAQPEGSGSPHDPSSDANASLGGAAPVDAAAVGAASAAMSRIVKLRVLGPRENAVPWIRQLSVVRNVAPGPSDTLLVEFVGDDTVIGLMVQTLVGAGLFVVGVEPERNELERIFMEVTRGDLQ
jgi:ABC-2 type transport system ATP-binding protein